MGTRSVIGVMHGDVCKAVYCHWDGYVEHNGRILQEHYNSAKANHLVALGDISTLRKNVLVPDDVEHSFESPADGVTVFYGRDRGDKNVSWKSMTNWSQFEDFYNGCGAEYAYIMRDGVWYVKQGDGSLEVLSEVLNQKEIA